MSNDAPTRSRSRFVLVIVTAVVIVSVIVAIVVARSGGSGSHRRRATPKAPVADVTEHVAGRAGGYAFTVPAGWAELAALNEPGLLVAYAGRAAPPDVAPVFTLREQPQYRGQTSDDAHDLALAQIIRHPGARSATPQSVAVPGARDAVELDSHYPSPKGFRGTVDSVDLLAVAPNGTGIHIVAVAPLDMMSMSTLRTIARSIALTPSTRP